MFRVGDMVKYFKKRSQESIENSGKITIITEIKYMDIDKTKVSHYLTKNGSYGVWPDEIIKINKESGTEIDFLDRIQQNFKEE